MEQRFSAPPNGRSVLLIKTSSLGDVIHALPVVNDLRSIFADALVDWVVERSLAALPRLHSGVAEVIPVEIRRWRRSPWCQEVRADVGEYMRKVRAKHYDAVVDAQGLLKSAVVSLAAHGPRYGLDFHSSREPLGIFYNKTFRIPWTLHAVERNRLLMARALGYEVPAGCDYGIHAAPRSFEWLERIAQGATPMQTRPLPHSHPGLPPEGEGVRALPGSVGTWARGGRGDSVKNKYVVLLHATSRDDKLWAEANWVALGGAFTAGGLICVLPWGNELERKRSARIAGQIGAAIMPPAMPLDELAGLLAGARAVIGVDTGLAHLAGALGTPTVGIYCATDPAATGLYGCARATNLGGIGHAPDVGQVLSAVQTLMQ